MDDEQIKSNAENAWQLWAEDYKIKKRVPLEILRTVRIAFIAGYVKAHREF